MRAPGEDFEDIVKSSSARLYDRLERALITLQYALADVRSFEKSVSFELARYVRSQEALLSAGEEVHVVLLALKSAGLRSAAERARNWG